jgi:hypothetical protein
MLKMSAGSAGAAGPAFRRWRMIVSMIRARWLATRQASTGSLLRTQDRRMVTASARASV